MGWRSEEEAALKEQKKSVSARNALGMRIPKRSSREKLCLNPREGWVHLLTFQTSVLLQGR